MSRFLWNFDSYFVSYCIYYHYILSNLGKNGNIIYGVYCILRFCEYFNKHNKHKRRGMTGSFKKLAFGVFCDTIHKCSNNLTNIWHNYLLQRNLQCSSSYFETISIILLHYFLILIFYELFLITDYSFYLQSSNNCMCKYDFALRISKRHQQLWRRLVVCLLFIRLIIIADHKMQWDRRVCFNCFFFMH